MINPKISVIIPVYNVEKYLEDTLNSIVNQTFLDNIEVLMIDDGSTDNSRYIIEKYALDFDNFYAFHKKNEGQCVARNFGLLIARGEYIHFMDSDDFIVPDAYEKLYYMAKKEDYDVVTFNHLRYDFQNTWKTASAIDVFDEFSGNIENTNLYDYKELSWDMPNCNKIIKKELLNQYDIKYYYRNILYEDNLFMIDVYDNAKNVAVLKDFIYFWRFRDDGTSTTQKMDMTVGNKFYEMVYLVNDYLTSNITDQIVLNKKYEKLLTINLYFFMKSITYYPKENQKELFEKVYEMVDLVPNDFFPKLNSYFQVIYMMVKNNDWDALLLFLNNDFKSNPTLPSELNMEYVSKLNFIKDSYSEDLVSSARKVYIRDNNLVIKFINFVPFNFRENFEKVYFKIINEDYDDILLDSPFIDNDTLIIPINLINFGESILITNFYYDGIKKENFMDTNSYEYFSFDDFDIWVKPGKAGHLHIFKRQKNDIILNINDIQFIDDVFSFKGDSNKKMESILINDFCDVGKFEYPVNYYSENEFEIKIPYMDFLKAPIKKWLITSKNVYNKINISKEFEFYDDNYLISAKNQGSNILLEFMLYDSKDLIKNLTQENNKLKKIKKDLIRVNNHFDNILSETFNIDKCILHDLGIKDNCNEIWNYSSNGKLLRFEGYSELVEENPNFFIEISIPASNLLIEYDIFQVDGKLNDYHVQFRKTNNVYLNGFSIKEMNLPIGKWHHIIIVINQGEFNVFNSSNKKTILSRHLNINEDYLNFQFKTDGDNSCLRFKNFKIYNLK